MNFPTFKIEPLKFKSFDEFLRESASLISSLRNALYRPDIEEVKYISAFLNELEKADRMLKAYLLLLEKTPGKRKIKQESIIRAYAEAMNIWKNFPDKYKDSVTSIFGHDSYIESITELLASPEAIKELIKNSPVTLDELADDYYG